MMLQNGGPLEKRASLNMQKAAGNAPGNGASAMGENRKGIQTAPKAFKRQHQVPAIPQISQKLGHMNSQAIGKPTNMNALTAQGAAKKDKNLLGYINKRMKLGETQQILFNHAINDGSPSHQHQHHGPSGAARPAYLQYEVAAERGFELA